MYRPHSALAFLAAFDREALTKSVAYRFSLSLATLPGFHPLDNCKVLNVTLSEDQVYVIITLSTARRGSLALFDLVCDRVGDMWPSIIIPGHGDTGWTLFAEPGGTSHWVDTTSEEEMRLVTDFESIAIEFICRHGPQHCLPEDLHQHLQTTAKVLEMKSRTEL